jgi:hypothetical protein
MDLQLFNRKRHKKETPVVEVEVVEEEVVDIEVV